MSDMTLLKVLRDMKEPFHVHGFRSTFTDWAANEDFADAVVSLLEAPSRAASLGTSAAQLVRTSFGWDRVADIFADQCARAAGGRPITLPGRS